MLLEMYLKDVLVNLTEMFYQVIVGSGTFFLHCTIYLSFYSADVLEYPETCICKVSHTFQILFTQLLFNDFCLRCTKYNSLWPKISSWEHTHSVMPGSYERKRTRHCLLFCSVICNQLCPSYLHTIHNSSCSCLGRISMFCIGQLMHATHNASLDLGT